MAPRNTKISQFLPLKLAPLDIAFQTTILLLICAYAFASRLFSVVSYESIIHEYDPWFNYRVTKYIAKNGFAAFRNWFDTKAWHPFGRQVFETSYYGMMYTAAILYKALRLFNVPVHIREVCVFMGPIFSCGVCLNVYFLTAMFYGPLAALLAAAFTAGIPGYMSRSVAGSYDYECLAIFAMTLTFLAWAKALRKDSLFWAAFAGISCFYMVSVWGGYLFVLNLIAVHALALVVLQLGGTARLHRVYSIYYVVSTLLSLQIPFVNGGNYFRVNTHQPALGVFVLLQLIAALRLLSKLFSERKRGQKLFVFGVAFAVVAIPVIFFARANKLLAGRILHLLGLKHGISIVNSISEHQGMDWKTFKNDINVLSAIFPVGVIGAIVCFDETGLLLLLFLFFSGVFSLRMVRVLLVFAPVCCIFSGIAVAFVFNGLTKLFHARGKWGKRGIACVLVALAIALFRVYVLFASHCVAVARYHYSHPTVILSYGSNGKRVYVDDYREAFIWLRYNTPEDSKVLSWWDYGYQITGFSKRTVYVDNNTNNHTHIARIGRILSLPEEKAYEDLLALDVDYLLVMFGGKVGYGADDAAKAYWIMKITSGEHNDVREQRNFNIDANGSQEVKDSLLFKMMYYRIDEENNGIDYARKQRYHGKVRLKYLEEAFSSENLLIRIFKLKKPANNK